jgi:hypothetical protein
MPLVKHIRILNYEKRILGNEKKELLIKYSKKRTLAEKQIKIIPGDKFVIWEGWHDIDCLRYDPLMPNKTNEKIINQAIKSIKMKPKIIAC